MTECKCNHQNKNPFCNIRSLKYHCVELLPLVNDLVKTLPNYFLFAHCDKSSIFFKKRYEREKFGNSFYTVMFRLLKTLFGPVAKQRETHKNCCTSNDV